MKPWWLGIQPNKSKSFDQFLAPRPGHLRLLLSLHYDGPFDPQRHREVPGGMGHRKTTLKENTLRCSPCNGPCLSITCSCATGTQQLHDSIINQIKKTGMFWQLPAGSKHRMNTSQETTERFILWSYGPGFWDG